MVPSRTLIKDNGVTIQTPPRRIEFHDGVYETDNKEEIEYLRTRMKLNGNIIEISPAEQTAIQETIEDEREIREQVKKRREARKKK